MPGVYTCKNVKIKFNFNFCKMASKSLCFFYLTRCQLSKISDLCFNAICGYLYEHGNEYNLSTSDLCRLVICPANRVKSELYLFNLLKKLNVKFVEVLKAFDVGSDMYRVIFSIHKGDVVQVS